MFPCPAKRLQFVGLKYGKREPFPKCVSDEDDSMPDVMTGQDIYQTHFFPQKLKLVSYKDGKTVPVESLRRKYLIFACFQAPLPSGEADCCRALIQSYPDLKSNDWGTDIGFEMIFVVTMRKRYLRNRLAFEHFLSDIPCLAIPFSHPNARSHISSLIGLHDSAIIVSPDGIVLHHIGSLLCFNKFGCDWAPFTDDKFTEILVKDSQFMARLDPFYAYTTRQSKTAYPAQDKEPLRLDVILDCALGDYLCRFDPGRDSKNQSCRRVLRLTKKYVGLYLCVNGHFMDTLKEVHDHCLQNNKQLEIVVVCMSIFDDPKSFKQDLLEALRLRNIKRWFVFESSDKVLRRMWRRFGYYNYSPKDRFIIVPPDGRSGEIEGSAVINVLGTHVYPFARTTILKHRLEALRGLTLDNLFNQGETILRKKGDNFKFNRLQGNKLLLYLDFLHSVKQDALYSFMIENHSKIKDMGWRVVFVPLDAQVSSPNILDEMPWPYVPHPAAVCVADQLTFAEEKTGWYKFLIGVGEDGRIFSRNIQEQIQKYSSEYLLTESVCEDVLKKELVHQLCSSMEEELNSSA